MRGQLSQVREGLLSLLGTVGEEAQDSHGQGSSKTPNNRPNWSATSQKPWLGQHCDSHSGFLGWHAVSSSCQ